MLFKFDKVKTLFLTFYEIKMYNILRISWLLSYVPNTIKRGPPWDWKCTPWNFSRMGRGQCGQKTMQKPEEVSNLAKKLVHWTDFFGLVLDLESPKEGELKNLEGLRQWTLCFHEMTFVIIFKSCNFLSFWMSILKRSNRRNIKWSDMLISLTSSWSQSDACPLLTRYVILLNTIVIIGN